MPSMRPVLRYFPGDASESEDDVNFWDTSGAPERDGSNLAAETGDFKPLLTSFKYIDDTTVLKPVPLEAAIRHFTTGPTAEVVRPLGLEAGIEEITSKAGAIGMRVNVKKTQLLCISPSNGCNTLAAINPGRGEEWIHSGQTLKLVGFTFGPEPEAVFHIEAIVNMYRRKVLLLFHLNDAGIKGQNLYKLYCAYIRSCIEYLSPVYHSMLHKGQEETLEKLHLYTIRICFGAREDVREVMANKGIETLGERRQRRADSFISKAAANPTGGEVGDAFLLSLP